MNAFTPPPVMTKQFDRRGFLRRWWFVFRIRFDHVGERSAAG